MKFSMFKVSAYLLLPLMWVNLTLAENKWTVIGLRPEVLIYGLTIFLACYIALRTQYRRFVIGMLMTFVILRILQALELEIITGDLVYAPMAFIYMIAGASIYGRNPELLHKQLVIFLATCAPIMTIQVLGVSQLVTVWDTSFLDNSLSSFTAADVGTIKDLPLYPTLFVELEDLNYVIGQARPAGLLYNNNPLSVFVSIAIAVNLAIVRTSRMRFSDIAVTAVAVLTMSKLVFGIAIILYLGVMLLGSAQRRLRALKLMTAMLIALLIYFFFFPGLFRANFSEEVVLVSVLLRLVDLIRALGIQESFPAIIAMSDIYHPGSHYTIGEGYTAYGTFIRSRLMIPIMIVMVAGTVLYVRRVRNMRYRSTMVYVVTLFACILSQFAVPFTAASSFQLIVGFSLFPLFRRLWPADSAAHIVAE